MQGDDDQIAPYADSALLSAKLLKNGTLKTYKGIPHGMPTTQATINADGLGVVCGSLCFFVPALEFRFAFFRLGLFLQFTFVSQKVHEGTGLGPKCTFSPMRGCCCNAKVFKQFLLRVDDTWSFGDLIRKQS
jgi:hypothetical protein